MADMTPNEALLQAKAALDKAMEIKKQNESFMRAIGPAILETLSPLLESFKESLATLKIDVAPNVTVTPQVTVPDITFPEIKVPTPEITVNVPEIKIPTVKVPAPNVTVTVPEIKIPKIVIPKFNFPADLELQGFMRIIGWDKSLLETPLPVQIRDSKGRPIDFSAIGGGNVNVEGSGGGFQYPTIANTANNPVPVTVVSGSTAGTVIALVNREGIYYNTDNPLPVTITSGSTATSATNIVDSGGAAYSGSNPIPVAIISGSSSGSTGQGDSASALRVVIAGNSDASVVINNASLAVTIVDSGGTQFSGSNPLPVTLVSGGTATSASNIVDSGGVAYSGSNPLPVTGTVVVSSITASTQAALVDSSGAQYSGSNPLPVTLVSGGTSTSASVIVDSTGVGYSGSNPVPVTNIGLPVGQGDSATAQRVVVAGDSVSSVVVNNPQGPGEQATSLRVVVAGDSGVTVSAQYPQAQGDAATALRVVIAGNSDASVSVTSFNGNAPATGLNETTSGVLRVVLMTDSVSSVYVNNPVNQGDAATALRVVVAGNSDMSVFSLGGTMTATVLTRTANPTAVANDPAPMAADKLGRVLTRPVQVRDLIKTAYVALSTGTETTLFSATAGTFADLIMVTASNNSTAATQLDIRATTGGNIIHTMYLPASTGPVGFAPSVPWPQDSTGNNWTIDMPDQTGTTVYVSALFSQEL